MSRRVNTGCRSFDPLGCMAAFLLVRRWASEGDQPTQGYNDTRFFAKRFRPGNLAAMKHDFLTLGLLLVVTASGFAQERFTLKGHTNVVAAVAFSPDGKTLASGGWDKAVRLWEVTTGKSMMTLTGHADWVQAVAFAPDGKTLVSASHRDIKVWDLAAKKATSTQKVPAKVDPVS